MSEDRAEGVRCAQCGERGGHLCAGTHKSSDHAHHAPPQNLWLAPAKTLDRQQDSLASFGFVARTTDLVPTALLLFKVPTSSSTPSSRFMKSSRLVFVMVRSTRRQLKFLRTRLGRIIRDIRRKIDGHTVLEARFYVSIAEMVNGVRSRLVASKASARYSPA